jgi:hypothetical protein
MFELIREERAAGDFGAVYMILIFAIAALLLVLIVKPLFQNSQKTIPKAPSNTGTN